tara:strand:+ start:13167 stop:14168 length:1002 start_codon:yes stop_codon:yes gene_type:complete
MIKKILNKAIYFFKLDLRWKLIKLNLYPSSFIKTGINKIYSKLILNILFNNNFKKYKKKIFHKVYNRKKLNLSQNSLISLPRSGSMFVRCTLSSYYELYFKLGDGIPKYDSINDKWIFVEKPIVESHSWNLIDLEKFNRTVESKLNIKEENFRVVFSRFPANKLDLFDLNELKPAILVRKPIDQIISLYTKHIKKFDLNEKNKNGLNINFLNHCIERYEQFVNFWNNYLIAQEQKNYIIIRYEDLINDSYNTFVKLFNFYNIDIDMEVLNKSIYINQTEQSLERLKNIKINKIRFTDKSKLNRTRNLISDAYFNKMDGNKLEELYSSFGYKNT